MPPNYRPPKAPPPPPHTYRGHILPRPLPAPRALLDPEREQATDAARTAERRRPRNGWVDPEKERAATEARIRMFGPSPKRRPPSSALPALLLASCLLSALLAVVVLHRGRA